MRVNDERGELRGKAADCPVKLRGVAGTEGDPVRKSVELRVMLGEADGVGGELDAGDHRCRSRCLRGGLAVAVGCSANLVIKEQVADAFLDDH